MKGSCLNPYINSGNINHSFTSSGNIYPLTGNNNILRIGYAIDVIPLTGNETIFVNEIHCYVYCYPNGNESVGNRRAFDCE